MHSVFPATDSIGEGHPGRHLPERQGPLDASISIITDKIIFMRPHLARPEFRVPAANTEKNLSICT